MTSSRPVRILLNGLSARSGGVQTYLVNLFRSFPQDFGAEIFVLAPRGLELPPLENVHKVPVTWPVENAIYRAIWEQVHLPRLIRSLDIDVTFCPGGIIGGRIPKGCQTVTMFRNMLPFDLVQRKAFRPGYARWRHWLLERVLMRSMLSADCVIFISEYARGVIETRAGRALKNAVVIPHGINPAFRAVNAKLLPQPRIAGGNPYLLYVSNIDPYKSHLEVVRAYALMKDRGVQEKLLLVGKDAAWDPSYGRRVRREIERLELSEDVLLAGSIDYDAMPAYYAHANLIVFASRCENCPNILLEALAASKPIACSNCQPMPEFAGDAAVYFDPASPADICDKICAVLSDPQRMAALSNAALQRSSLYDWTRTAAATWNVIEKCCPATTASPDSDRQRLAHATIGKQ